MQAQVIKSGLPVQAQLSSPQNVYFEGSFDLSSWRNYGKTNSYPASMVRRYLYNYGEQQMFYRAVT